MVLDWVHSERRKGQIVGEMTHFVVTTTLLDLVRVHAERIGGDNQSAVNNDNIAVTFKFEEGSVAGDYAASGDKAYSGRR